MIRCWGILFTNILVVVRGVEIRSHSSDIVGVVGDMARLWCGVERHRDNKFTNCSWVGPDRRVVWVGGGHHDREEVVVERDQDLYYCVLEISRLVLLILR